MPDTSKSLSLEFFFFINPRCPPGAVPTKDASIDVRPGEVINAPEREPPAAILETDNSEAGEHLSTVEVGLGNKPLFSTYSNWVIFCDCSLSLVPSPMFCRPGFCGFETKLE